MIQSFRITSASVSDRGLNEKRPHNEDAFLEIPQSGLFAVADGVGGAQAGEVASQMAMEILAEAFVNLDERNDAEEVMQTALKRANSAINKMSMELPQLSQMATTVVALHIAGNIATIGHAGDSRLYSLDADGTLRRETADHSMVAEEVRAGRMTEEQADNHPGKNIISRALGAEPIIEIELKTVMVSENTTFLICSDGVTRHIGDPELGALLRSSRDLNAICERIKAICFERGAQDNLTAVLVRLDAAGQSQPVDAAASGRIQLEEITVAAPRSPVAATTGVENEEDDLLELDTTELTLPSALQREPDVFTVHETPIPDRIPAIHPELETAPGQAPNPEIQPENWSIEEPTKGGPYDAIAAAHDTDEHDGYDTIPVIQMNARPVNEPVPIAETQPETVRAPEREFELFGNDGQDEPVKTRHKRSGTLGRMVKSVGLLLLGSVVGLAAYHFLLADRFLSPSAPLIEPKSNNQPQTAFEENRRNVDKDPAAALALFEAEPVKDAENHFLTGRAYLLLGKYPEARKAFLKAQESIKAKQVDASNGCTIQTEMAIYLTVLDDPGAQLQLKPHLENLKAPANAANSPSNQTRPPANSTNTANMAKPPVNGGNAPAAAAKPPANSNARPPR